MWRQSGKKGIIMPRDSMANVYAAHKLPDIFGRNSQYLRIFWDMREKGNMVIYDRSGNDVNGILIGPWGTNFTYVYQWANSKYGGVNFDKQDDRITIAATDLSYFVGLPDKEFTINIWAQQPDTYGSVLFGTYDYNTTSQLFGFVIYDSGVYSDVVIQQPNGNGVQKRATNQVALKKCNMYSITFPGSSNYADYKIYINGILGNLSTFFINGNHSSVWSQNTSQREFNIGRVINTGGSGNNLTPFGGNIYCFSAYDKCLSDAEIKSIYENTRKLVE